MLRWRQLGKVPMADDSAAPQSPRKVHRAERDEKTPARHRGFLLRGSRLIKSVRAEGLTRSMDVLNRESRRP
jgi:hypothetical protein